MAEEQDNNQVDQSVAELVIARLDVLPPDRKISVGSEGEFTKADLIQHVKDGDSIGKTIIALELEFLRALKDGTLLEEALSASSQ